MEPTDIMGSIRTNDLRLAAGLGTSNAMDGELRRLCIRTAKLRLPTPRRLPGQIVYPFDSAAAWTAINYARTPSRVYRDLYALSVQRLDPLYEQLKKQIETEEGALWRAKTLSVTVKGAADFPSSPRQLVGCVKNAWIDGVATHNPGVEVSPDSAEVNLVVTTRDGQVIVSHDIVGRSLASRGYRLDKGKAPIRENLAATLLTLARYQAHKEILIDPMCGSGTIALEAALAAQGHPLCRQESTAIDVGRPDLCSGFGPLYTDTKTAIWASDVDPTAIGLSHRNAERSGVAKDMFSTMDYRKITQSMVWENMKKQRENSSGPKGLIVVNPPYGRRLSLDNERQFFQNMGAWLKKFPGWRVGAIVSDKSHADSFPMKSKRVFHLRNGGLEIFYLVFQVSG